MVETIKMLPIAKAKTWYDDFVGFSQSIMKKDLDYGTIPGVAKPSLFKAGAEKLRVAYNLTVEMSKTAEVVDYDKGIVDISYKCIVKSPKGQTLAECEGNVNSFESKYRYSWVTEDKIPAGYNKSEMVSRGSVITEFQFALQKMETSGQYGKPQAYWDKWVEAKKAGKCEKIMKKIKSGKEMVAYQISAFEYRINNPDVIGLKNTIMKMAQKRAFVGAMLMATGASEFFTQDVEDMEFQNLSAVAELEVAKTPEVKTVEAEVVTEEVKTDKVKDLENSL